MSGFIPEDILEEVRNRCDIVEVINGYIPLKRAGASYKAPCPFHNEKTPSFSVSSSKQIYHCFGCGAGGNVFNFVMQYEKLDFVEAVRLLADKVGIAIPEKRFEQAAGNSKNYVEINKRAAELFHQWLYHPEKGKIAYSYLRKRGIRDDIIKKFLLGYALPGNEMIAELSKNGFKPDALVKAGLAMKTARGVSDMFRNRLMFPVFNASGKVVGFSGRVLGDGLPKYVNTPETPVFHKGKILYGLHAAKIQILKQESVVICEGYFDFLRAYQEGVENIVASQGTAFTADHVALLRRLVTKVVLAFDSDTAGENASLRGIEVFFKEGLTVKVLELPKGDDPDSFIREKGIDRFRELMAKAKDILEVKLDRLRRQYPVSGIDGKLKILGAILGDINNIGNEIYKREFIKKVSSVLAVPEDAVLIELGKLSKKTQKQDYRKREQKPVTDSGKVFAKSPEYPGEKRLAQLLLDDEGELRHGVVDESIVNWMVHPGYKSIVGLILDLRNKNKWRGAGAFAGSVKDENLLRLISGLCAEEIKNKGVDKERIIRDCVTDIVKRGRQAKMKVLMAELVEREKNKSDISGLMAEIGALRNIQ